MYISKNKKSGIFYIYYRKDDGKKTRVSTRTWLKSEAMRYLKDFDKRLKKSNQQPSITMEELRFKYLTTVERSHTRQSNRIIKNTLDRFLKYVGKDTLASEIDKEKAQEFIFGVYQNSPYSADLLRRHLHACWEKMIAFGYVQSNPFKKIRLSLPENNPVFINKKELELIASKEANHTLVLLYRFAFYSGMRLSEIINLEYDDVKVKEKLIYVKNKDTFTTKSKRERVIPISKSLKRILKAVNSKDGIVFNNNGKQFNPDYVSKSFKKCVRTAGLNDKIHFHSMRHSFSSYLVQNGANMIAVQKILGHASIKTTQIYLHLRTEDLVKAIKLLD
jgi:integrase/recombinase XerD